MNQGFRNELTVLFGLGAALSLARKRPGLALGFAATAAALQIRPEPDSFHDQSVVITGGSRGLGLALALRLAKEGAKLTLLARNAPELLRAAARIAKQSPGAKVLPLVCDVTDRNRLAAALREAARHHDGIDLLVNNAGSIMVGPFECMEKEDFETQMKLHLYAVIDATKIALPYLRQSEGRRIVNICSMGGRVAVPHMLPYDASKFALAGFSQGLMAELAAEKISVTTIFPALMRTGSPIQAIFKGDQEKEFAWFAAADALPGLSLSADDAAEKIVEAARARRTELMPSLPAKARMLAAAILPETLARAMQFLAAILPKGHSTQAKTGAESRALYDRNPWLLPLRRRNRAAERAYNQRPQPQVIAPPPGSL